jgi:hypothetical protein
MKIVSQLDANGYFVAAVEADESQKEPGVFHVPGGAIDVPPPTVPPGKVALWQGSEWAFVNPPTPEQQENPPIDGVPQVVSMRQARLALLSAGLLQQVEASIDALPEPQRSAARIEWDYSSEVHRDRPFVQQLSIALGLDDAQIDALFVQAAQL